MRQAASIKEKQGPGPGSELPVGEILRRTRLHYNQTIPDIERVLRIKGAQIEAIENGDHDKLPGRTYVIGFVRAYAEYLGLDGQKMTNLLKAQSVPEERKAELHFPVAASESKIPNLKIVGASLVLALTVLVLWWVLNTNDRSAVTEIPTVPETMQSTDRTKAARAAQQASVPAGPPVPAPVVVASGADGAAPEIEGETPASTEAVPAADTPAAETKGSTGIILKIIRNSWVEIKDTDGKAVVSRVLKAGDKYFVPDSPGLLMSLGNSGGVELEIDGQNVGTIGTQGEVMRNIPLEIKSLRKKYTKPVANTRR